MSSRRRVVLFSSCKSYSFSWTPSSVGQWFARTYTLSPEARIVRPDAKLGLCPLRSLAFCGVHRILVGARFRSVRCLLPLNFSHNQVRRVYKAFHSHLFKAVYRFFSFYALQVSRRWQTSQQLAFWRLYCCFRSLWWSHHWRFWAWVSRTGWASSQFLHDLPARQARPIIFQWSAHIDHRDLRLLLLPFHRIQWQLRASQRDGLFSLKGSWNSKPYYSK